MSDKPTPKPKKIVNQRSLLLDDADNETLFRLLGPSCCTLSSAVVQLLESSYPMNSEWEVKGSGVACFVKDFTAKSYFIRIYDLKEEEMIWEHELYKKFQYKTPRDFFHTFETNNAQIGLNFSSEDEALKFRNAINNLLSHRQQRQMTRKSKKSHDVQMRTSSHGIITTQPLPTPDNVTSQTDNLNSQTGNLNSQTDNLNSQASNSMASDGIKERQRDKNMKKQKINRKDISSPFNFRVVNSVVVNENRGFNMSGLEEDMKRLLHVLGVNPEDQVDMATIRFVLDFVNKNGGIQAVRREISQVPAPSTPAPAVPTTKGQITDRRIPKAGLDRKQLPPPPPTPVPSDKRNQTPDRNNEPSPPLPPKPHQTSKDQNLTSSAQNPTSNLLNQPCLPRKPPAMQRPLFLPESQGPKVPSRVTSDMSMGSSFSQTSSTKTSNNPDSFSTLVSMTTSVPKQSPSVTMAPKIHQPSPCQPFASRPRQPPPSLPPRGPNSSNSPSSPRLPPPTLPPRPPTFPPYVPSTESTLPSASLTPPTPPPPPPPALPSSASTSTPPPPPPPLQSSTSTLPPPPPPVPSSTSTPPPPPPPSIPPPPPPPSTSSSFLPPPPPPLPASLDLPEGSGSEEDRTSEPAPRNNLTAFLDEIVKGKHLNSVERRDTNGDEKRKSLAASGSIISQLVDAFDKMRPHIEPDEDDYDSDEFKWDGEEV